jgi:hypothetical protein
MFGDDELGDILEGQGFASAVHRICPERLCLLAMV